MEEAITKNNTHLRIFLASALCLVLFLLLLTLGGRALATHLLINRASLALLDRWKGMAESSVFLACPERSDPSLAVQWLEAALALAPRHEQAWLQKGRALWLEGRCAETVDAWRKAVALNARNPVAWLLLIEADPTTDVRPDPAIAERVTRYLLLQGGQAYAAQEWEQALKWYGRALSLTPNRLAVAGMEVVYLQLGRKEDGIARWRELAVLLPDSNADHWWALGRAAELVEEWEEAAGAYGQGAERAQEPYYFRMRQAYAYGRLQDWGRAERAYRQAVEARPNLFSTYLSVGDTLRARQDYEGALAWYRQAEDLAPGRPDPKYYIGYTCYLLQDYPTAEAYAHEALAINPQHAWSAYLLANCLYQRGEQERAIAWLRSAIEWHVQQPWNWAMQLGNWLVAAGDRTGALAAYRRALEWKPGDEYIQKKIQEMLGTDSAD